MKTIKYIVLSLLMGSSGLSAVMAQQTNLTYSVPTKIEKYNGSTFQVTQRYFDGLERLVQSIEVGASAKSGKDIVSFQLYDNMGRADATTYLSFVAASAANNGTKIANPVAAQQAFYQSWLPSTDPDRNYTFAQKQYENSPRNFVVKEGGIGVSSNITVGKPINHQYLLNTASQIKDFRVNDNGQLVYKGYLPEGVLRVHRVYTGNNGEDRDTYEYVNQAGQIVASETYLSSSDRRITYYVYDDLGRQRYVIPAIQESQITAAGTAYSLDNLKKYCFYTEYDGLGNPIRVWSPGGICTSNVYDLYGRLILSQNPEMAKTNQWVFSKYDIQDRPVISGVTTISGTAETVSKALQTYMTGSLDDHSYEMAGAVLHGYTNQCYPTQVTASQVLNVTYYDNYDWITNQAVYGFSAADAIAGTAKTTNSVNGRVTGKKTKVLGITGDQWLTTVTYFDENYNAIQTISDLYPSGIEIVSNKHNFNGQVIQTKVKQVVNGVTYEYNKWIDYDSYGRLLKIRQKITGDPQNEVVLAEYAYDDLGQVVSKKIHGNKEETTYTYDVAGRSIAVSSPSFSYKLGFDKSIIPGVATRTDGLVSQITWSNSSTGSQKAYAFTYDKMGQYQTASYYENSGSAWAASPKYKESIGGYDKNGNILSLQRTSSSGAALHNYTYTYGHSTNGNALTGVTGSAEFLYDANGNMVKDGLTGVQIEYDNVYNLPKRMFSGADQIVYTYSASGQKLASQVGNSLTYYRGMMVYSKNGTAQEQLMYMHHPEGLVAKEGTAWVYKYFKVDYRDNTRALLAVRNGALVNEMQNTDYYPLGYAHSLANLQLNKYLYAGKEYQDAKIGGSALGLYDFQTRYYNPLLGRWFNPDPANQFNNPYIYCGNNPMLFVDPDGRFAFWLIPIIGAIFGAVTYTVGVAFSEGGFNNWNWGDFGMSFAIGAVSATATYGVGQIFGATGTFLNEIGRSVAHGLVQGGSGLISGGDFWSSFASGSISSLAATGFGFTALGQTEVGTLMFSGLSGGIGSAAAGGDFWRGAGSGLVVAGLNHLMHKADQKIDGRMETLKEAGKFATYQANERMKMLQDMWDASKASGVELLAFQFEDGSYYVVHCWDATPYTTSAKPLPGVEPRKDGYYYAPKSEAKKIIEIIHTHVLQTFPTGIGISKADQASYGMIGCSTIINMGRVYMMTGGESYLYTGANLTRGVGPQMSTWTPLGWLP